MYVDYLESPLGLLKIKANDNYLKSLEFVLEKTEIPHDNSITQACILQLLDYFENPNFLFSLPLDPDGTDFQKSVWKELLNISSGKSLSYIELAIKLGDPKKTRAVGSANGKNPIPIIIPCHRVVGKNNSMVGYSGGIWRKNWLLQHESKIAGKVQQEIFFD